MNSYIMTKSTFSLTDSIIYNNELLIPLLYSFFSILDQMFFFRLSLFFYVEQILVAHERQLSVSFTDTKKISTYMISFTDKQI
jgi:hypothetical protein